MLHWYAEQHLPTGYDLDLPSYNITQPGSFLSTIVPSTTDHPPYINSIRERIINEPHRGVVCTYIRTPELVIYSAVIESINQILRSNILTVNTALKYNAPINTLNYNGIRLLPQSDKVLEDYVERAFKNAELNFTDEYFIDHGTTSVLDNLSETEVEELITYILQERHHFLSSYDNHLQGTTTYTKSVLQFLNIMKSLNGGTLAPNVFLLNLDTYSENIEFIKLLQDNHIIFNQHRKTELLPIKHVYYNHKRYYNTVSKVVNNIKSPLPLLIAEYAYFKNLIDTQIKCELTYEKLVSLNNTDYIKKTI